MRPVAAYAEIVLFLTVPAPGPFAVESVLPLPKDRAMALSAEVVGLLKLHNFAVSEPQCVPVVRVMAVKAPASRHMLENDVLMHHLELAGGPVDRHAGMTLGTGEDPLGKGRGSDKKLLRDLLRCRFSG